MEFHEEKDDEFTGPSSVTSNGNCEESNSTFSTHEGEICLSVRTSIQVKLNVDLEVLDEIRNRQGSVIGDYTIPTSFRLNTKWIDVLRALQVPYDPEKYVLKGHGRKINIEDTVESFYLMYTRRLPYYTVNLIFAGKDCRKQRQPFPEDSRPSLDTGLLGNLNPNGVRRSTRQKSSLEKKKICSRPDRPKRKSALRRKILSETSTSSEEHDHNGPEQIGTSKCSLSNDVFQTTQTEGTPTKVKKKEWESTLKNGSHSIQSVNLIPDSVSVSVSPDERGPANLETSNSEKDYSESTTSLESIPSFSNHDRTQNQPEFLNESIVQVVSEAPKTLTHDTDHTNDAELIRFKAASANSLPSLSPKDFEEDTTTEKFLSGTEVKCERIEVEVSTSPISETIQMIPPNSLPVTPSATAVTGEDPTALLPLPVDSRVPRLHVEIESDAQVSSQADIEAEPSSSSSHVTAEKFSCLSRPTQEPMDLSIPRSTENLIKQPTPEDINDDCCVISGNQKKSAGDSTISNAEQDILIKPHLLTYINRHYTNRDLNKVYKELRELTEDMQIHQLGTLAPFTSIFLTTIFNNSRILEQLELEPEHPSTSTLQPSVPATPTKDLEGSSESTGDCT